MLSLVLVLGFIANFAKSSTLCGDILKSKNSFTGSCFSTWSELKPLLKPTQSEVGYSWIMHKVNKDFTSAKNAQKEITASPAPVVIGPDNSFYLVDDHHTLCALDYTGYTSTNVTVEVLCDRRGATPEDFWVEMQEKKFCYLGAHPKGEPNSFPVMVSPNDLPQTYDFMDNYKSFADDPWRSMAAYSRKVQTAASPAPACTSFKYCERCMFRGCDDGSKLTGPSVYYFEFRWGYFMLDATYYNTKLWESTTDRDAFYKAFSVLPVFQGTDSIKKVDTNAWDEAASMVVSLCRGAPAGGYAPPADLFPGYGGKLPGYVAGYTPINDADPDCDAPSCAYGYNCPPQ